MTPEDVQRIIQFLTQVDGHIATAFFTGLVFVLIAIFSGFFSPKEKP
jgi:hypothetical protein